MYLKIPIPQGNFALGDINPDFFFHQKGLIWIIFSQHAT